MNASAGRSTYRSRIPKLNLWWIVSTWSNPRRVEFPRAVVILVMLCCQSAAADDFCGGYAIPGAQWRELAAERFQASMAVSIPLIAISFSALVSVLLTQKRYSWFTVNGRTLKSARHAFYLLWLPLIVFGSSLLLTLECTSAVAAIDRWAVLGLAQFEALFFLAIPAIPILFCVTVPIVAKTFGEAGAQFWVWFFSGSAAAALCLFAAQAAPPWRSAATLTFCAGCFWIPGRYDALKSSPKSEGTSEKVYWTERTWLWWFKAAVLGSVVWFFAFSLALAILMQKINSRPDTRLDESFFKSPEPE